MAWREQLELLVPQEQLVPRQQELLQVQRPREQQHQQQELLVLREQP